MMKQLETYLLRYVLKNYFTFAPCKTKHSTTILTMNHKILVLIFMPLLTSAGVPCAYGEEGGGKGVEENLLSSPPDTTNPPVKFELSSSMEESQTIVRGDFYGNNNVSYCIYDLMGILQVASSGTINHGEIVIREIASLSTGQYTLVIEDGNTAYEYSLIIE